MKEESKIWSSSPSQISNLGTYIVLGLFSWMVIPIFIFIWYWLVVKNTQYELTTQRLTFRSGVLNKQVDEMELYRVRDYKIEQPFFLRLFSLGNIVLETSDRTHPLVTIQAVKNCEELMGLLREHVEECREAKGVRELDVE